jgi:hypothetical protein
MKDFAMCCSRGSVDTIHNSPVEDVLGQAQQGTKDKFRKNAKETLKLLGIR